MSTIDPAILGHVSQQADLLHAYTSRRLGNAYLFTGPRGVGKKLVALGLAKALTCQTPLDQRHHGAPCLRCSSCTSIAVGTHPDVQVYRRDKTVFSVDQMRDGVLEWASRTSRSGGRKIGVIEDVDLLHAGAANAFLKTLEEPPNGTLWVLITSDVSGTLTTIVSRCRRVYFEPLLPKQLEDLANGPLMPALKEALSYRDSVRTQLGLARDSDADEDDDDDDLWGSDTPREGLDALLEPAERSFLLAMSQGAPGALVDALRNDLYALREWLVEFLTAPKPNGAVASAEDLIARLSRKDEKKQDGLRARLSWAISIAQAWIRDAAACNCSQAKPLCNQDRKRQLERWAKGRDPRPLLLVLDRLDELRAAIERNASPKLVAANFMLELATLRPAPTNPGHARA